MLTFVKKIVIGQKKIYIILSIALSLLSCFEFIVLSLYTNSNIGDEVSRIILRSGPTIAVFVSFFLTLFINNFFVNSKTEEFSIILLSGRNLKQILKYIIIQFGPLFIVTAVIGGILGLGSMLLINNILSTLYSDLIFNIDLVETVLLFLVFLILKLMYVTLLNQGKFYQIQTNIVKYMKSTNNEPSKTNYFSEFIPEKKKKFPIGRCASTLFAIFIMIISIRQMFSTTGDIMDSFMYVIVILMIEVMLINSTIPLLFDILHDRFLLKHPTLLMALSQLMDISTVMISVINTNAIITPILISLLMVPTTDTNTSVTIILCFIIIMIMMMLSFLIRFSVYLPTKITDIATLKAIGYREKQIHRIQTVEITGFLLFILGIPIVIFTNVLYQGYLSHLIELSTVYLMSGSYIVFYVLLCGYMIVAYKSLTKEVLQDVKYLNRGE